MAVRSGRPEPLACRRLAAYRPGAGAVRPRHRRLRPRPEKEEMPHLPKENEVSERTPEKETEKEYWMAVQNFVDERAAGMEAN